MYPLKARVPVKDAPIVSGMSVLKAETTVDSTHIEVPSTNIINLLPVLTKAM